MAWLDPPEESTRRRIPGTRMYEIWIECENCNGTGQDYTIVRGIKRFGTCISCKGKGGEWSIEIDE